MSRQESPRQQGSRRGAVVVQLAVLSTVLVQLAVLSTVLIGSAALTIDIGAMYVVRGELQRAADAAALAAVSRLSSYHSGVSEAAAVQEALRVIEKNPVQGRRIGLDPDRDIEFGQAVWDSAAGRYRFVPGGAMPNAVRVRVRKTSDSANGPVRLTFANIFGVSRKDMGARAAAMIVPRDISVVIDLSGSMNDDSELQHYDQTAINLWDIWAALPKEKGNNGIGSGVDPPPPGNPPCNDDFGLDSGDTAGPTWGRMYEWGSAVIDEGYDPAADAGLFYLPYKQSWFGDAELISWLQTVGYSPQEITALLNPTYDSKGAWNYRVAVALGLARWDSGIPGGLWASLPPEKVGHALGNGDDQVGAGELTWLVDYPFPGGSWLDYISYAGSGSSRMARANSAFRYRFGLKTFVNYLLERRPSHSQTPDLGATPEQPLYAVKTAVKYCMELIESLETGDQVSLEVYGQTARHEVDLTTDYAAITERLLQMQAAHYDGWTNMGAGINEAINELHSPRARQNAVKVMFLLTDGQANVTSAGVVGDYSGGKEWALSMAQAAASAGIKIFCISVGSNADRATMQQIAEIGGGKEFLASGHIDEYSSQLVQIFGELGSKRPIRLIE